MKYKVGDKVRVKKNLEVGEMYGTQRFVLEMEKYKGGIVTISDGFDSFYFIEEDGECWCWAEEMLEEFKKPTKKELFNMPTGTIIKIDSKTKKDYLFVKVNNVFINEEGSVLREDDINEDLTLKYIETKILEIQKPTYITILKEEKKKMTLEEIEKILGYSIELIEE